MNPTPRTDIVFTTMPFALREHPALGLSLLKAALAREGVRCAVLYNNLPFADDIGWELYDQICEFRQTDLIGEWIFSRALYDRADERMEQFVDASLAHCSEATTKRILQTRSQAPSYADRAAERILACDPRVVGFTSTFEQHTASIAVAKRLKAARPDLTILFGGSNCEGPMGGELIRQFPFIDAVVSGEADLIICELAQRALAGVSLDDLQGVYTQTNIGRVSAAGYPNAPSVMDLDTLPFPDFSDLFAQTERYRSHGFAPRLLFETSRGCWWGAKHHCTFCGLNGSTMAYRSKSAARSLGELQHLVAAYGTKAIGVVDNILDMRYFNDFIPELTRHALGLDITYEVKANLKKEQLLALRAAGIRTLQPGVESLSTPVLKLMDKGVRALQNIQLLKWCQELGIFAAWNILWGFPGEPPEEYAAMAALAPLLTHLRPPIATGRMRLDRFSPNFDRAREKGLVDLRPSSTYSLVYDMDAAALANFAYYFDYDYAVPQDVEGYTKALHETVERWKAEYANSALLSVDFEETLLVVDFRAARRQSVTVLSGVDRLLYLGADAIAGVADLQVAAHGADARISREDIHDRMARLIELGLALREGESYLALAIPLGEHAANRALAGRVDALLAAFAPSAA